MTSFILGIVVGSIIGGFGGFVAAALLVSSKADALSNQSRDEATQPEPQLVRAARLMN